MDAGWLALLEKVPQIMRISPGVRFGRHWNVRYPAVGIQPEKNAPIRIYATVAALRALRYVLGSIPLLARWRDNSEGTRRRLKEQAGGAVSQGNCVYFFR